MAQRRKRPSILTSKRRLSKEERRRSLKVGLSAVGGGFALGGGGNYVINLGQEVFEREQGRQKRRISTSRHATVERRVEKSLSRTRRRYYQRGIFERQEFQKTSEYQRIKNRVVKRYAPVGLELKKRYNRARTLGIGEKAFRKVQKAAKTATFAGAALGVGALYQGVTGRGAGAGNYENEGIGLLVAGYGMRALEPDRKPSKRTVRRVHDAYKKHRTGLRKSKRFGKILRKVL